MWLDLDFLLGHAHDFFSRRDTRENLFCAFIFQHHHAFRGYSRLANGGRIGLAADKPADFIVQHEQLKNAGTASIAGLGAGRTSGATIERRSDSFPGPPQA